MATIKLKEPPRDGDDDNDIKNNLYDQEAGDIIMEIKQEPELILESEFTWLPTKLEDEQEYYQQYWHNDSENEKGIKLILPPIKPDKMDDEEYAIEDNREFLSDNEDVDDAVKGNGDDNDVSNTKITKNTDLDDNIVANGSGSTRAQSDTIEENREFLSDNDGDNDEGNGDKDDVSYEADESADEEDYSDDEEYNSDDDDYMNDGDDGSDSFNVNIDVSYTEITKNMDLYDNIAASGSGTIKPTNSQTFFNNWLRSNYMHYVCPICKEKLESNSKWKTHINEQHANLIENTKSSYYFINKTRIICKQCRNNLGYESLLTHSLKHAKEDTLELYMCNICNFKFNNIKSVPKHILKEHPNVQELFENLKVQPEQHKCPLCPAIYTDKSCLRFHFKDNHQNEYRKLFRYPCHLCEPTKRKFDNLQDFLKHLLEEHNLKDIKLMNFKFFTTDTDGEQIYCTKCYNLYTDIDLIKFARHYLEHESQAYKNCKACSRKFSLKHGQKLHVCPTLRDKYKLQAEKTIKNVLAVPSRNQKKVLPSWKEFEEYIKHICPFCNTELEDLQNWLKHLRNTHNLDTLKGLKMKQISKDSHKLQCNVCQTLVTNKSVELHTHCFQHLHFKPYKCKHCSQPLNNYKLAIDHVLNTCQNLNERNKSNATIDLYEIICPLCNKKLPKSEAISKHFANAHDNFLNYYTQQKDNTWLICHICQLDIKNKIKLYRSHILQHFEQKLYRCIICSKTNSCRIYEKHLKYHFAVPINKATEKNSTEDALNNSQLQTFGFDITPKARSSAVLNEFSDYILFACPECNENVSNQQLWFQHITENHDFFQEHNLYSKNPQDGSLKCKHCNMIAYNSIKDQQKHKLLHMPYKAFICGVCYHGCTTLGVLYDHLRRLHFNKGSYDCVMCSEVLTTQYAKIDHIKTAHPKSEWPANMCSICFKTVNIYKMKSHLLTHDLNRPKFECKYCCTKLLFERDLKIHTARHEKMLQTDTSKKTIEIHTTKKSTSKGVKQKNAFNQAAADDDYLPKEKSNKRKSNSKTTSPKTKKGTCQIDTIEKSTPKGVKQKKVSKQAAAYDNFPKEKSKCNLKTTKTKKGTCQIDTIEKSTPKGVKQKKVSKQAAANDNFPKEKSKCNLKTTKTKKGTCQIDTIEKSTPKGVKQKKVSKQAAANDNIPKEKSKFNSKTTKTKKNTKKKTIQIETIEKLSSEAVKQNNASYQAAADDNLPKEKTYKRKSNLITSNAKKKKTNKVN